MATSAPKRRKLDHANPASTTGYESLEEQSDVSESSGEGEPEEAKRTAPRQKRSHGEADNAIYSGGLFKSSMFKLQVDEMLAEVKPNYEKRLSGVNDALRKLKGHIEGIEAQKSLSVRDIVQLITRIKELTNLSGCRSKTIPAQDTQDSRSISAPSSKRRCEIQARILSAIEYQCCW